MVRSVIRGFEPDQGDLERNFGAYLFKERRRDSFYGAPKWCDQYFVNTGFHLISCRGLERAVD